MSENLKDLMDHFHQPGTIAWIGLRPLKKAPLSSVETAEIVVGTGLVGDHYQGTSGNRDVTLIQAEHLEAVGKMLGKTIDPGLTRRNLVVSGLNLLSMMDKKVKIGDQVVLEITGLCHPCSRMEENLGFGGYNAMRGHGGLTSRVLTGGKIKVGDPIEVVG